MPTIQEVIKDQDFVNLPFEEKKKVFTAIDSDFKGLPGVEQDKVLNNLFSGEVKSQTQTQAQSTQITQITQPSQPVQSPDFESMINQAIKPPLDLNQMFRGGQKAGLSDFLPQTPEINEQTPEWARNNPELFKYLSGIYQTLKPTMEMVGMAGGQAAIPVPALGAGVGYGATKNLERGIEGKLYGKPVPPIAENLIQTAKDTAMGTSLEGGAQLVGRGIEKVLAPFGKIVKPGAKEAEKQMKELGLKPQPSDVTGSQDQARFESILSRLFGSGGVMRQRDLDNINQLIHTYEKVKAENPSKQTIQELGQNIKNQIQGFLSKSEQVTTSNLKQYGDDILRSLGSTDTFESIGKKGLGVIDVKKQVMRNYVSGLYSKIDEAIPENVEIPTTNLKKTAEELQKRFGDNPAIPKDIIKDINDWVNTDKFGWHKIEDVRRVFRTKVESTNIISPYQSPGAKGLIKQGESTEAFVYNKLKKAIELDQENYMNSDIVKKYLGTDLSKMFKDAKLASSQFKEKFTNPEIIKALKSNPEDFVDSIFKPRGIEEIKAIKSAIGDKEFNEIVRPGITNKLLGIDKHDAFNPEFTKKQLERYGKEVLDQIYTPKELNLIKTGIGKGINLVRQPIHTKREIDILNKFVKLDPHGIIDNIYTSGTGKTLNQNVDTILKTLDKETKEEFKNQFIIKLFTHKQNINPMTIGDKPANIELQTFSTKVFRRNLNNYHNILSKFLSKDDLKLARKIANVGEYLGSAERLAGNPSGTGQAIMTGGQISTAASMVTTGIITGNIPAIAGGGAVMTAPYFVAKLYTSPLGRKYLTEGFKVSSSSIQGTELLGKMVVLVRSQKAEEKELVNKSK